MTRKEAVYDTEIYPLMARIITVCKRAGIACLCTFDISKADDAPDDPFLCTTCVPDGTGSFPDVIKACELLVRERPSLLAIMSIKQHTASPAAEPGDRP